MIAPIALFLVFGLGWAAYLSSKRPNAMHRAGFTAYFALAIVLVSFAYGLTSEQTGRLFCVILAMTPAVWLRLTDIGLRGWLSLISPLVSLPVWPTTLGMGLSFWVWLILCLIPARPKPLS